MTFAGRAALPPAFSASNSAWVRKNGDLTFRSMTLSQPFSGNASNGSPHAAPALLTRISSFPSCSANCAASALQPATVETSCGSAVQLGPSSAAVAKQTSALRAEM